jgi:hypothetical protein
MTNRTETRLVVELRRENNEREWSIYGDALVDVMFLRRRGFVVHRQGRRYRVDRRLLTREGMAALARRERRLTKQTRGGA